jgi:hypothetical protein
LRDKLKNKDILTFLPPEPEGPPQVIDPNTGDFTLEEKIRRLKDRLIAKEKEIEEKKDKEKMDESFNERGSIKSLDRGSIINEIPHEVKDYEDFSDYKGSKLRISINSNH